MHHPFTAPHPDDVALFGTERQGEIRAQAYDLVHERLRDRRRLRPHP